MIEGGRFPCAGRMATGAIAFHAFMERIGRPLMATRTIGFAFCWKQGMVEFPCRLPALRIMAGRAFVRQFLV